jgi:hypothetical protein
LLLVLSKSSLGVAGWGTDCLLEVCERERVAFFTVVPELRVVLVATGNSTLIHSLDFSAVSITVSSWHKAV